MSFKPDFICVGAAKAGTTTLHDLLVQHPDIFVPRFKEAHFFDVDDNYRQGLDWYRDTIFGDYKRETIKGEITPSYLYFEDVPARIHETVGTEVKLVFMFRHPVERAWSHFRMQCLRGNEDMNFLDACAKETERVTADHLAASRFSYIGRGYYARQLKRYLALFPRGNMFFIRFEDFVRDIEKQSTALMDFLGVESKPLDYDLKSNPQVVPRSRTLAKMIHRPSGIKQTLRRLIPTPAARNLRRRLKKLNAGPEQREQLDPQIRQDLFLRYYARDTQELAGLTGLDLSDWIRP